MMASTAGTKVDKETSELLTLMRKYKLNAPKVAEMVGVKPNTVRKWCCGLRPVPFYALKLIKLLAV
jgi:DNA-binding transcriptional regulator YiaG